MIGGMDFYTYIWIWTDNEKGEGNEKTKKIEEFIYIFHNEALFFPYSSHLTS